MMRWDAMGPQRHSSSFGDGRARERVDVTAIVCPLDSCHLFAETPVLVLRVKPRRQTVVMTLIVVVIRSMSDLKQAHQKEAHGTGRTRLDDEHVARTTNELFLYLF